MHRDIKPENLILKDKDHLTVKSIYLDRPGGFRIGRI